MIKYISRIIFSLMIALSSSCSAQTENETVAKGGNINVTEAKELLATDKAIKILDVRTPQEVEQGKIEGSVNINIQDQDFKTQLEALPKEETYLVYCRSGGRSSRAAKIMAEMGFKNVYNMKGGYSSWE